MPTVCQPWYRPWDPVIHKKYNVLIHVEFALEWGRRKLSTKQASEILLSHKGSTEGWMIGKNCVDVLPYAGKVVLGAFSKEVTSKLSPEG